MDNLSPFGDDFSRYSILVMMVTVLPGLMRLGYEDLLSRMDPSPV